VAREAAKVIYEGYRGGSELRNLPKATLIGCLALLLASVGLVSLLIQSVNQRYKYAITKACMMEAGELLRSYYQQHGEGPNAAFDYLVKNGVPVNDQWLRRLHLVVLSDGFQLVSYASDGESGGKGCAADIMVQWTVGEQGLRVVGTEIRL
jgi:hypothetical protein